MSKVSIVVLLLVAVPSHAFAQSKHSTYVGQERREIKSLSSEDIEGYLTGQGMGFAKAAELNHYPGPKHVLQLAEELRLSKGEVEKTRDQQFLHLRISVADESFIRKKPALDPTDTFADFSIHWK